MVPPLLGSAHCLMCLCPATTTHAPGKPGTWHWKGLWWTPGMLIAISQLSEIQFQRKTSTWRAQLRREVPKMGDRRAAAFTAQLQLPPATTERALIRTGCTVLEWRKTWGDTEGYTWTCSTLQENHFLSLDGRGWCFSEQNLTVTSIYVKGRCNGSTTKNGFVWKVVRSDCHHFQFHFTLD